MDPQFIDAARWELIALALRQLVLFVTFMVCMALTFLMAHALIPSLITMDEMPRPMAAFRPLFYAVSAISLVLMVFSFGRAVFIMVPIIQYIYPRYAI
jgi:hypothetical protein